MGVTVVVGGQWGDEGKGKIVDMLAERVKMVVRFSGGDNAGHTVINPYGEFRLHLVPSGIFYPNVTCIIGNGVVVNPEVLLGEVAELGDKGLDTSRLFVSNRANLIMPYHILMDGLEERSRGGGAIGTTGKGIGPAYSDKVGRMGIRVGDLLEKETFEMRLTSVLSTKNAILTKVYGMAPLSLKEIRDKYMGYAQRLAPYVRETEVMLHEAVSRNETVLFEGAQGTLLDPDFGTYPYVTSSSPMVGNSCCGAGLAPSSIECVLGVYKAYTTRVGSGPMVTELKDDIGSQLRERAHEYGATTGRARRCGWFDAVVGRYSSRLNGLTAIALTRLDILDVMPVIKICTGYKVNGTITDNFPSSLSLLEKSQPIYEELPGWKTPIDGIDDFERLPLEAREYVRRVEELLGCRVAIVSVGARREQTIEVGPMICR